MVRSLWTAATGMISQQTNVDTIANNLANVNTTGYKSEVAEFKSLLYQTIQTKTTTANGENKPVGAQVGLGVRNSAITSIFKQGSMLASESNTAFAIQGDGLFAVRGQDGQTYYTRNGNFLFTTATNGMMLATSDGLPVLSSQGNPIILNNNYVASRIGINSRGELTYPDANNNPQPIGVTIGLYQFTNPSGLEKIDSTMFAATAASGAAINEATNNNVVRSNLLQGYLEGSSVQVADEMVNLIVAQRAYEMNSRAITTTDEMLQQANQLKR
ncbi:MAG: flagellar hook-basal body protein [Lachnospiraceae bacterium]|nr:flagellar hook-basal body protein [Lachnospiraceae bacterium]MDD7051536.1 flagellar hook-basal body protein [Lachnospiraceae bacterium]MDY4097336.1 flagellar hook-basal body protein [Lachnospiraceae bacterium]